VPDDAGAAERGGRWFVGREDVLDTVLAFLEEPGKGYRLRAGGTWGIGKTWLIEELRTRASERAVVLHVKAGAHKPSAAPTGDADPETLDVVRNWNSFTNIVIDLIQEAPETEEWGALAQQIHESQQAVAQVRAENITFDYDIEAGRDITASGGGSIASPTVYTSEPVARLEATIDAEKARMLDAFARVVDRVGRTTGAFILVDEYDRLQGHLVADWLLQLVTAPEHAVVVVATRIGGPMSAAGPQPLEQVELRRFSRAEVGVYLERRLGKDAVDDALVARVCRFSDGLPQAVAMATDLIEQRRRTGGDLLLDDLNVKSSTATAELLSTIVSEVPELDVQNVLKEGRFTRRIDADLIHYLLYERRYEEGDDEQRRRADEALAKLKKYSFVESYDGADDGLGRYRFHEYITRTQAPPDDPTLEVDEERVHARLAAYYERRHDQWDEEHDTEGPYKKLYKLESLDWQALAREWLYHMSRLNRPDVREVVEIAFVRVFLQTFWWWGCYVRYDYCEQLLNDWERLQPQPRRWTGWLHELLDSYPPGYQKLDKGDWAKVDRAMRKLRDDLHLGGRIRLETDATADDRARKHLSNRRMVRALTSLFRAHSYKFRTDAADLAADYFDDALNHFRADEEASAVAWTTFELAELLLALNDVTGASEQLQEAARVLGEMVEEDPDDEDYELRANLQRLHGDITAATADWEASVDATARAVLRAYAFLNEPEPPDPYTVAFYEEMRERAAQRLLDLRERDGNDAEAAAKDAEAAAKRLLEQLEILRRPFQLEDGATAALASGKRAALVALLPPPPSKLGDDALDDETFATTAARVLKNVRKDPSDSALAEPA
jgi:hypothetical protein